MTPPPIVRRWEALSAGVQALIALPVAVGAMLVFHLALFPRLSFLTSFGYAVFWGVILAGLVVIASRSERARRQQDENKRHGGDQGE